MAQERPQTYKVKGQYSIVEPGAIIGEGTVIWHYALVRKGAVIGENCVISSRVEIGPDVHVGDGTHIGAAAQLHSPAQVGKRVFFGPQAFVSNDPFPTVGAPWTPAAVVIEDDAVICAKVGIKGGVTIHQGAVCGLGATVIRDVASGDIVYGCPAVVKGRRHPHYPGTAIEHWGPLNPEVECHLCKSLGVEQYRDPQ